MLLLRPEVYAKLMQALEYQKNINEEVEALSSNPKLNDNDRWIHLRQILVPKGEKWRNQQLPTDSNQSRLSTKPEVRDKSTQIHIRKNKHMETQTNQLINKDDYITNMNIINNARLDEEISNIDINDLTSPTNRLSLSNSNNEFHKHAAVGASAIASALKKQITSKIVPKNKRVLSYDDDEEPSVAIKPKNSRSHLKRSAAQPDQMEINFPARKNLARYRVQTGTSIRNIKWTRI